MAEEEKESGLVISGRLDLLLVNLEALITNPVRRLIYIKNCDPNKSQTSTS